MSLTPAEARARLCYLETTGRVSARPHEIEIWFAADPDDSGLLYLLSGGRDRSDWVRNIRRTPGVRVRVNGSVYRGAGRLVEQDDPVDRRAREVVAGKYQDWRPGEPLSDWARTSRVVVVRLDGQEDA
jgi:deazaflavin-dependent oxidoreductase (nitroreductase family)